MSSNSRIKVQLTSPMGPDGIVRCHHGEAATRVVGNTPKNPGRVFYACSRAKAERCNFWYWADDPIFNNPPSQSQASPAAPHASQNAVTNGPPTPQATSHRFTSASSSSTLHSTPPKRQLSEIWSEGNPSQGSSSSADTPGKRARFEAIQAGLRARREDEAIPHSQQQDALPFTDGVEPDQVASALSPTSETETEIIEIERRPVRYSFLNLPPSQESLAEPSTPKKRVFIADRNQGSFVEGSSSLITPPQSLKQRANRAETLGPLKPEPTTPTRSKGKERATCDWNQFLSEDEPLGDIITSLEAKFAAARDDDSSSPPTTGELITTDLRRLFDAADTIRACIERLGHIDSLGYIGRLERQRNAFKTANDLKKKRIEELGSQLCQKDEIIKAILEKRRTPSAD